MTRRFVLLAILVLAASRVAAYAQTEPVRLFVSNGVRPVVQALTRPAEGAIARPLNAQFNTTTVLRQKIDAGEPFDVAILTAEAIDGLIKAGKLVARSRTDIGSAGIGVGVRKGAKKPDIRGVEAMKQTLVSAKSVTYASDGASRPHIEKMFDALGITSDMKAKTKLFQGSDASMASVASGESEMVLTLESEIMQAPGIELVGPLPDKFQNYVHFAAGISPNAKNADAANALIQFLTNPKVAPTFRAKGIQPGK